jgi:glycosyltransferase involved in cell wall biosynthesis
MKIGIHASNSRSDGGVFQFLATLLDALFQDGAGHEFYLFHFYDHERLAAKYARRDWRWVRLPRAQGSLLGPKAGPLALSWIQAALRPLGLYVAPRQPAPSSAQSSPLAGFLAPFGLDLMIFPQWTDRCWQWGVPYVFVVHDLQHRLQPHFPEVSIGGKWAWREHLFSNGLKHARRIVVDSEEGKKNVVDLYGVDPAKVAILPYPVSAALLAQPGRAEALAPLGLPPRFFVYPAQFWPHKNHYRVVEAVRLLKKNHGLDMHVVFPGGESEDWGASAACRGLAESSGIAAQIHYPGYVDSETLAALYRAAVGLVMPTYFGPTNIPYLEAFHFRCPVIASDLPGIREQVGEAALLVDPDDAAAIARAMHRLWSEEGLRERLVAAGTRRLQELGTERFGERVRALLAP